MLSEAFTVTESFTGSRVVLETAAGMASATEDADAIRLRYYSFLLNLTATYHADVCNW